MEIKYLDTRILIDDGYLQEANRQFFHPLGLALVVTKPDDALAVLDCREDPEGFSFADKVDLRAKGNKIAVLEGGRYAARRLALGYWVQHLKPA